MRHFIHFSIHEYHYCMYYYNDEENKIKDFSHYRTWGLYNWSKYRVYRGEYVYSKAPHYENSKGKKEWWYNGEWCNNYEEYLLAAIG